MGSYLKDVLKPQKPSGFSSDKSNLKEWSDIASENSLNATRAKGGAMSLPDTGGAVKNRSTSSQPKGFSGDPYAKARGNTNHAGDSSYMRGVRRIGQ